jgi:hypothetical protein
MTVDRLSFSGGSPLGKRGSFLRAARGDIDQGTRLSCYYLSVEFAEFLTLEAPFRR